MHKLTPTALGLSAFALALLGACGSGGSDASFENESSLSISPAEFDLTCGGGDDASFVSYSATLVALTATGEESVVGSPVTACNQGVRFAFKNSEDKTSPQFGVRYVVELLGFSDPELDEPDPEIATWVGSCGRGAPPAAEAGAPGPWADDAGIDDFYQDYWGPKRLVAGRNVAFHGCWFRLSAP